MKRIAVALLAVVFASVAPHAQDVELLLKAAINTELVDGNLQSAIEQYKKVAQSANRTLAAQALVRMAECYQKLGDAQARKIFDQVIREYGDQKESVSIARARLGEERAATAKTMALRKVWSGPNISSEECGVSSDGRYITCPAWETGDLGLHDVMTGADRLLTTNNWAGNQYAQGSAISKDGKQVAYAWFNGKRYELRLTSLHPPDTKPRTVLDNEDIDYIVPSDWTPDGESVVARLFRKDHTAQIGLVSVKDGSLRTLKTTDWASAQGLFLSPDGRYIAFDLAVDDSNSNERDVFELLRTHAMGARRSVVPGEGPAQGSAGLYQIDAQTGQTTRLPFEEGVCAGAPQLLPDGKKIYFFGGTDCPGREGSFLLEGDMATGDLREIFRGPGPNNNLALSPDGRFFAGERREGRSKDVAVVLIPVDGGKITELLRLTDGQSVSAWGVSWAPDGRNVIVTVRGKSGSEILLVPTDGGPASKLQGQIQGVGGVKLHPNGHQIAFSTGEYKAEVWVLENFLPAVSATK